MALLQVNEFQKCVEEYDDCQQDAAESTQARLYILITAQIEGRN